MADEIRDFFAEIFVELDARPREIKVKLSFDSGDASCQLDIVNGELVFSVGEEASKANFRHRWIAEHSVPLRLRRDMKMKFIPTTGNRVKVRVPCFSS